MITHKFTKQNNCAVIATIFSFATLIGPTEAKDNFELDLEISVTEYGPNGSSFDGSRIYLLPIETTTVSPPDLAVCGYSNYGEVQCQPKLGSKVSPCPDSRSCDFKLVFDKTPQYLTISIFDIDSFGHETVKELSNLLDRGFSWLKNNSNVDIVDSIPLEDILNANEKRWSWIESSSYYFEENNSDRNIHVEKMARQHASQITPPQFSEFLTGRIATPFETKFYDECLYPFPSCSFNYSEILLKNVSFGREGDN